MTAHVLRPFVLGISAQAFVALLACSGGATTAVNGGATTSGTGSTDAAPASAGGPAAAPATTDPTTAPASLPPGGSTGPSSLSSGLGSFTALLTDAPNPDVREINVTVSSVRVHVAGAGWVPLTNEVTFPMTVNLLDLQGTVSALGFVALPAGKVTQIRLLLAQEPGANWVVLSRPGVTPIESAPLEVPSGYESGIKIMGPWDVEACSDTEVTVDFDGKQSIWYHSTGHDKTWILRPVIRVKGIARKAIACPPPPDGEAPPPVGLGGACTKTADCAPDLVCAVSPDPPSSQPAILAAALRLGQGISFCSEPAPPPPLQQCLVPEGGTCTASTECASGSCTGSVCTAPGQPQPIHGQCTTGAECATGLVCYQSQCLVPPGGTCTATTDCASGATCGPAATCGLPLSAPCQASAECVSSNCTLAVCAPGGIGAPCQQGAECLSGSCDAGSATCAVSPVTGACTTNADCPSDSTCDAATNTCGPGPTLLPIGATCTQGAECAQGNCDVTTHTCQPGLPGAPCTDGSQCTGGMCSTGMCLGPAQ